ncbi:hypothetical protein F4860DRAFT_527738 [Xylaria cubensis]|nr:hypothetical protein F4860DRAFT_527738 [Xylaria cubensis]
MDARDRKPFGRQRGRGARRGSGARSDRGGRGRGFHNANDRSHGLSADQDTNISTTSTNNELGPAMIIGSREQIEAVLRMLPAEARLSLSFDSPTLNASPIIGNKRKQAEEEADLPNPKRPKKTPENPEAIDVTACGNCGAENHKAAFCVKTGRSGWMEACPKCDSTKHIYEACPQRKKGEEDFIYLVYNRQRKPPVKSRMKLGKVIKNELARTGTKWHQAQIMELPYSPAFARKEARLNPPETWNYAHFGDPTQEAKGRTPEPSRTNISLIDAATKTTLEEQAWSQEEEEFDPAQDGEIPIMRQLKDPKKYEDLRKHHGHAPAPVRRYGLHATAFRKANDPTIPCDNCGQINHFDDKCLERCAACGERDHSFHNCSKRTQACICEKFPRHLRKDCQKFCEYCVIIGNNNDPHYAKDCPAICHYCLDKGHKTGDCPPKSWIGRGCFNCIVYMVEEPLFHLPSQCVSHWCCHTDCKGRMDCEIHCMNCGWSKDDINLVEEAGRHHVCQFRKSWDYTTRVPEIQLRCFRNNHILKHKDLVDLHATVLEETKAMCKVEREIDPWINECPKCRADMVKSVE